jgi:probable rRNA maturation factor
MKASARRKPARVSSRSVPLAPVIDIVVDSPLWKARRGARAVLRRAMAAAAAAVSTIDGELAIVLTDDSAIWALNRTWRGKDQPTNVLSFPMHSDPPPSLVAEGRGKDTRRGRMGPRGAPRMSRAPCPLGDIVIAYETTAREADAQGKPFADHLSHLAVHGFLHLLGYDHQADAEAEVMEALEIAILARLGVPNPYIARGAKG